MNRLRLLRKERGISMKEFGSHFGLAESTISQYETEKRQLTPEMILTFSEYFGVTTDYLLGKSGKKEKASALAEKPIAEDFEQKLYRALVSGGVIPPGGDLTDKQVEILDAIATIIDATFGD